MAIPASREITRLLIAWNEGDQEARERVASLVEPELRRLAERYMRSERSGHTLQPTALINEAYLRLLGWKTIDWQSKAHFVGVAANMMRRVLVDHARSRKYDKREGDRIKVSLDSIEMASAEPDIDLVALDEALTRLAALDPEKSKVVELRFFGGLSVEETATVMKTSTRTVERLWKWARVWLHSELTGGGRDAS